MNKSNTLSKDNLFWGLVNYHVKHNLPTWLEIIDEYKNHMEIIDGVAVNVPRRIITTSNAENKGDLSFTDTNGKTYKREINGLFLVSGRKKEHFWEENIIANSTNINYSVSSFEDIEKIILSSENKDGGYFFNNKLNTVEKVQAFTNHNKKKLKIEDIQNLLYPDFFSYDKSISLITENGDLNLGTRTSTALSLAQKPGIDSFIIKQSSYTDFGLGKVIHFDNHGLDEEFFLCSNPRVGKGYAHYDGGIFGVYRNYRKNTTGKLTRITVTKELHHNSNGYFIYPEEYKTEYQAKLSPTDRKLLGLPSK